MQKRKNIAYLSLGANIGDPLRQIADAIRRLDHLGEVFRTSSSYETAPIEVVDQPWFVNCAVGLYTDLPADALMKELLLLERGIGRIRDRSKGPRIIDVDLLLFNQEIIKQKHLRVPHPEMHHRRFVLEPLAEIAPEALHPGLKKTVSQMLAELGEAGGIVRRLPNSARP